MDGIETLKQIRSHNQTAYLPVIILTSSDDKQDLLHSYQCGANSYILKPVDFSKFLDVILHLGLYWLFANKYPAGIGD